MVARVRPQIKSILLWTVVLYVPFLCFIAAISGHLQHLGDASLFFSDWTDAPGYKAIADYYVSLGKGQAPSADLLNLRPFLFPAYLSLYQALGVAGIQVLQVVMNGMSLGMVVISVTVLTGRLWLGATSAVVLAITPSFNFLVFHGMTETISILLVSAFATLVVARSVDPHKYGLFWPTLVLSTLLCIRPIVLPFWAAFVAYYVLVGMKTGQRRWREVAVSVAAVGGQLILSFVLTGTPTLSSSGATVLSAWYFPVVYQTNEYGQFTGRKSIQAQEGLRLYPDIRDKIAYLAANYRAAIRAYLQILVHQNVLAQSNFVQLFDREDQRSAVRQALIRFSSYLNIIFAGAHLIIAAILAYLLVTGAKLYRDVPLLIIYSFAAMLIVPAGLSYLQGDRFILLAAPLWSIGHAAVIGYFLNVVTAFEPSRRRTETLARSIS